MMRKIVGWWFHSTFIFPRGMWIMIGWILLSSLIGLFISDLAYDVMRFSVIGL